MNVSPILGDLLTLTLSVVYESVPFVVLGVLVSVGIQNWVPDSLIHRILPKRPVQRRAVLSLVGMLFPVCECGNVPLARGLMLKGLTVPESATFLLAAPILNPIVIVTTYQAFGWDGGILIGRIVGGFLIANLIGWVLSKHANPETLLVPSFAARCEVGTPPLIGRNRWRRAISQFTAECGIMLPAVIIGATIAGAIQAFVPQQALAAVGGHPVLSVLVMLVLAFCIAVCSNVDAFFALSFGSTFLPGGLAVFLVFGAMIDIKMLALLKTTFTAKALLLMTGLAALGAACVGLVINSVA
ncbi:permease [Lysinibacter cavernae]|uniref:Permease n=1 Tax=Lysinibacter cavernae TaxID=1640652 RepID=A0A7X5R0C9_9MICO|nr:permease [Lysinibacter cavernae]NIH53299.1 hypothetical protein [Lysinibacter cavernae]